MARILIAEDERDIRDLITFTLRFAGHEVIPTANGEEAYTTAKEIEPKPDLIMMDVRMPKMTGYEACKAIKAEPAIASIPVVFLSAKGQESEVNTGIDIRRRIHIEAVFPDQLMERVKTILNKYGKG
jgi:CheY-like chemotaxis protein